MKQKTSPRNEDEGLDWGPQTMQPSRALQQRLKHLKQPINQVVDALPGQDHTSPAASQHSGSLSGRWQPDAVLDSKSISTRSIQQDEPAILALVRPAYFCQPIPCAWRNTICPIYHVHPKQFIELQELDTHLVTKGTWRHARRDETGVL